MAIPRCAASSSRSIYRRSLWTAANSAPRSTAFGFGAPRRVFDGGHFRRDREIDELGKGLQQQGQALERQGQALERQGAAMTKAFTQQGEVLAELLRRTA